MSITAAQLKVDVIADTSKAEQGVTSFSNKLDNVTRGMRNVGAGMTAAITAPLVGIAVAGLKSAMQFEQNMNVLQQAVGASAAEMQGLQDEALRLGAETMFGAGEAAEAMVELGKSGMDTEDIMASIGGVLDLAAAGGVGLAEAAGLTASALSAFGLEASESSRVADIFAATANASQANISDLGQGMKQAGFAFRLADQPIENLAASLAILTNVGLTGSDAGTALKNAFMRMMNPTKDARGLMDELGISFYDANGNMKMLPDIIDNLNNAMSGLTNKQRDAALTTLFLSDGMKAMVPLMDVGKEGFNGVVTEVTQVGAAMSAADARTKGLSGGIEYLFGSIDSFMIGAALPFLGTINDWVIGLGDAITQFGELPQPVINAGLAIAGVLAVAGPLLLAISFLAPAFALLTPPMIVLIATAAALSAAWATNFGDIQTHVGTAMATVQEWLKSTVSVLQDFGKYISFVVRDGDYLNDWLTHLPSALQPAAQAIGQGISIFQNFGRYIALVVRDGDYLNDWLTHLPSGMQPAVQAFGKGISVAQDFGRYISLVVRDGDYLNDWLTHLPSGMQPAVQAFGQGISVAQDFGRYIALVVRDGDYLNDWLTHLPSGMQSAAQALGQGISIFQDFGKYISLVVKDGDYLNDWLTHLPTSMQPAAQALGEFVNALQGFGPAIAKAFGNTKFPSLSELWKDFQAGDFDTLATKIRETAFNLMVNLDTELNISGKANQLREQLLGVVTGLTTAINDADWEGGGDTFAKFIDGLKAEVQNLDFSGIDWANVLKTGLLGPIKGAIDGITWVFGNDSFKGLTTAVSGAIGTIPWGDLGTAFAGLGTAIVGEVVALGKDMATDIATLFTKPPTLGKTQTEPLHITALKFVLGPFKPVEIDYPNITVKTQAEALIAPYPNFKPAVQGAPIPIPFPTLKVDPPPPTAWESFLAWPQQMVDDSLASIKEIDSAAAGKQAGELFGERMKITVGALFLGWKWADDVLIPMAQSIRDGLLEIHTNLSTFDYGSFSESLNAWGQGFNDLIIGWMDGFVLGLTGITMMRDKNLAEATSTADILRDQQLGIKTFEWPPLPTWEWPGYTAWEWPGYLTFIWPGYLIWEWPAIPTPDWLASLLSWNPFGGAGAGNGAAGVVGGGDLPRMIEDEGQGGRKGRPSLRPPVEMEPIVWSDYVKPLMWEPFVTAVEWSSFVTPLTWDTFVSSVDWESFVPALSWDSFVASLDWGSFVDRINWGSFISDVSWNNYIPGLDWGVFVQYLDWGRFVPAFAAPSGGGAAVASTSSRVSASGNDVVSAASDGGVTINVNIASMNSDMDIHSTANKLAREFQRRIR